MFFVSVLFQIKRFLRAGCKKERDAASREERKKVGRCDKSKGTARTCDGSATIG